MGEERVGTCSLCGGNVVGVRGGWWSTSPPPPDTCSGCGAITQSDIIKMVPRPGGPTRTYTTDATNDSDIGHIP